MKTKVMFAVAGASAFVLTGCGGSSDSTTSPSTNSASSSPIVQPEIYAQKKADLASLTQAIQQYNAAEGHYPQTLQDLAPTYLAKVPQAPPGYKFSYDSNNGSVSVAQQ